MSSKLNLYYNEKGTSMVAKDPTDGCFMITVGPKAGMDGDTGTMYKQIFFVYNDGDTVARQAEMREIDDSGNYFMLSVEDGDASNRSNKLQNSIIRLGDINPRECVKISINTLLPAGTKPSEGVIKYELYSYVLPNEEYVLVTKDATGPNEEEPLNLTTHVNAPNSKGGKPYGNGSYGKPFLYGQEGLVKITKQISTINVIAGMEYSYVEGTYAIRSHYTGREKNIEDIQSYYSNNYYDLDAYDGPILPLFLDDVDEGNTEVAL